MAAKKKNRSLSKGRKRPKGKYTITNGPLGPTCILLNSRGKVVNAINGSKSDTEEDLRRAAKKWFPEAREVKS